MKQSTLRQLYLSYVIRNSLSTKIIDYGLYLYFLGLLFRNTVKAFSLLHIIKINHVSICKWIQKYKPKKFSHNSGIKEFVIDEIGIKVGSELIWLRGSMDPINK
ncbi:MAG TPA: hypothetical protein VIY08_14495 [Candidatus Nitrosocosmicus sp.]